MTQVPCQCFDDDRGLHSQGKVSKVDLHLNALTMPVQIEAGLVGPWDHGTNLSRPRSDFTQSRLRTH